MSNQNDNPTVDDLDLSGIEGYADGTLVDETQDTELDYNQDYEANEESYTYDDSDGPISWSSLEGLVPEPLHEDLRPVVDEWRRQYERVLDETLPYRQYADRGVSERDIELALNIQNALLENPRRFYEGMGETYGWNQQAQPTPQQQYQQYAQPQPQPQNEFDAFFGLDEQQQQAAQMDPRIMQTIEQTQARLAQLEDMQMQAWQTQQEQEQLQFGRQQLEGELEQLSYKYGDFDRTEVVKRAIANASAGGDPSVTRAFHEMKDYETRLRQQFVSSRPPRVMGSGNGMSAPEPVDLSSDDAKANAALALAIRLGAQAPTGFQ